MWKFLLAAVVIAGVATIPSIALASQPSTDRDCSDFATQPEAQTWHLSNSDDRLDSDGDGVACESLPTPERDTTPVAPNDNAVSEEMFTTVSPEVLDEK